MKTTNIAEFKNQFNQFISLVESGEEIELKRKNIPIARIIPVIKTRRIKQNLAVDKVA